MFQRATMGKSGNDAQRGGPGADQHSPDGLARLAQPSTQQGNALDQADVADKERQARRDASEPDYSPDALEEQRLDRPEQAEKLEDRHPQRPMFLALV